MQPFDCLDSKTDIFGPHLLEASAGTGKTFAIEHLFVRFLLEVDIKEILVVTFTKAATAELKRRIFQNIEQAIHTENHTFDYLLEMQKKSCAKEKLNESLFAFDDAQIFTIHGFCQRMLAENFLQAKVYFDPETSTRKMKKALSTYLRENMSFLGLHPYQMQMLVNKFDGIEGLCDQLLIKYSDDFGNDLSSLCKDFSNIDKGFKKQFLEKIYSFDQIFDQTSAYEKCLSFIDSYKKTGFSSIESLKKELKLLLEVLQKKECSDEALQIFLSSKFSILRFFSTKNLKKNKEELSISVLQWGRKELLPLIDKALNISEIFFLLQKNTHNFLKKLFEKEGYFSPDRILEKMKEASLDPDFRKKVQNRYKVLIIDEFQDTDPMQWSIFENLFLKKSKLSALYLVGDPKQSIYRFRKADLYTYLQAQNVLGVENVYHLTSNFRSHKSLISSLNALFHQDFANKWLTLPKLDTHLDYLPVEAKKEEKALDDHLAPLHFFIAEEKSKQTFPSKKTEELKLFPFIFEEIVRLKKEGFKEKDFAILVKDRFQAKRIMDFLYKMGIASSSKSTVDIRKSSVYIALKDLFEAVLYFPNLSFMKKSLVGVFFNLDLEDLEHLEKTSFYSSLLESFSYLKQTWESYGLPAFFREFLQTDFFQNQTTIIDSLCFLDEAFFHDLKQLIELLLEYADGKKSEGENIFALFDQIDDLSIDEEELLKRKNISVDNAVQIITIHMSKGLEYSIVFALGLCNRINPDPLLSSEELLELDAEKMRQFYVALTRAKNRVYLPFVIDQNKKVLKAGQKSSIELFLQNAFEKEAIDRSTLEKGLEKLGKDISLTFLKEKKFDEHEEESKKSSFIYNSPLLLAQDIRVFSFSSIADKEYHLEISATEDSQVKELEQSTNPFNLLPAGTETGILLHGIIEKVLEDEDLLKEDTKELSSYIQEKLLLTNLQGHENLVLQMIKRALFAPIFGEFSCLDIPKDQRQIEMDVLFPLRKEGIIENYMKGIIDLAFYHKGKYYLVDWKSNLLNTYDLQSLEEEIAKHEYDLQASIYAESFRRYIENIEKRSFEKSFGGYYLVFLRGLCAESSNAGVVKLTNDQLRKGEKINAILSDRK